MTRAQLEHLTKTTIPPGPVTLWTRAGEFVGTNLAHDAERGIVSFIRTVDGAVIFVAVDEIIAFTTHPL